MSALLQDVVYVARALARRPGFALVVILSFALGIGASTAIIGAVRPILFAPLPYPDPGRLVALFDVDAEGRPYDVTHGTYVELAARSRALDSLAVSSRWQPSLAWAGEPERLEGEKVSIDYFAVLGAGPAVGRAFTAEEAAAGGPKVAIVAESLARRLAQTPEAVLGQSIELDGESHVVIGVMPATFENVLAPRAEVWTPLQYRAEAPFDGREWGHHLRMVGRLSAGVSIDQARRELAAIASTPLADGVRPAWASLENGLLVEPLRDTVTTAVRPVLLAVLGAVLLLLAIASVNVASLLLARNADCRREIATRAALGAGPGRVLRQRLTESLVLAVVGGIAGLGVATVVIRAFVALAPPGLPRVDAIAFDGSVLAITFAITAIVGIAVGLPSALQATRVDLRTGLQGARSLGRGRHSVRKGLVVVQIALALVLLVGAGLLLRSLDRILSTAPGFEPSHTVTMQVVATGRALESSEALRLYRQMLDAVRNVPGVSAAAFTSQLPLTGDFDAYGAVFESAPLADGRNTGGLLRYAVTPDWFRVTRVPLLQGRLLGAEDRAGAPIAVLVNESFAKRRFGGRSPIGARVRFGPQITEGQWSTIVGVVGDVRHTSLALPPPDTFYVAMGQWPWVDDVQTLVVRADGDPLALVSEIKRAVWSVDPSLPIARLETMADLLSASESRRTFALIVFSLFSAAAFALATIGLYGVVAGSVADRTGEIGLRAALGATRWRILTFVLRQGLGVAVIGIAIGLVGAAAASRGLASLLFGIDWLDPPTYLAVTVLVVFVAVLASLAPASRAARLEPTLALRTD